MAQHNTLQTIHEGRGPSLDDSTFNMNMVPNLLDNIPLMDG